LALGKTKESLQRIKPKSHCSNFLLTLQKVNNSQYDTNPGPASAEQVFAYLRMAARFPTGSIAPQAIRSPALPPGCETKSSGIPWITTVLPRISRMLKRSVITAIYALPPQESSGGRSPACSGWDNAFGL